jgi:hypothetical protein
MYRLFAVTAVSLVITGCVSVEPIPLAPAAEPSIAGKRLAQTRYKKPDFSAMTAGKAVFGLIGAVAMVSAGNRIVEENKIDDPASMIAEALTEAMQDRYKTVRITRGVTEVETDDVAELSRLHPEADVIVDIRTLHWSFVYFPTNWARYRVMYVVRARLIDSKGRRVLAEGVCKRIPDHTDSAPTHDELLSENAAGLKRELRDAAQFCLDKLKTETFRL